ncbi:MAG: hypothetical protein LBD86_07060 [Spirochaetaceae bacterium]|jgi:hypothetical protein|nr:hypothetical protein [Spirochaetaceae bacterium]
MRIPSLINGAALFQKIVDKACVRLEQKNAGLVLIRIGKLDSLLSGIEKRLGVCYTSSMKSQKSALPLPAYRI